MGKVAVSDVGIHVGTYCISAVPLPFQLAANGLGKTLEDSPSAWVSAPMWVTHMKLLTLGFRTVPAWLLMATEELTNERKSSLFLSLELSLSFGNCDIQINK